MVIHEVDALLRELIEDEISNGEQIEVSLEAPDKDWAARRTQPTVNAYLYDVRRDVGRNESGTIITRDENGQINGRRPMPVWFRLAYLVTAWTQRPEDEHRLLSALLNCFVRKDSLPLPEEGALAELGAPLPLGVAMPPPQDRSLSDVWSAMGGDLKPSIDVVVIAPMLPDRVDGVGPPVTVEPIYRVGDIEDDEREEVGGRPIPPGWESARVRRPPPRNGSDVTS